MLRIEQLAGTRLLRACSLLARRKITGKTAEARARVLDARGVDDRLAGWIAEEAAKRGAALGQEHIQRLVKIASRRGRGYRPPARRDLAVILCHFNPVGWATPPRLLNQTCETLVAAGIEPVVAQAVRSGCEPAPLPDGCRQIIYTADSVLFHKENLWNLAAEQTTEPKLLFVDGDIAFSRRDILDAVSIALDEFDIVQPFSVAAWLDKRGGVERKRKASAEALAAGTPPILSEYHPGFSWALTRRCFDAIGGFYERHPLGSGDTAFVFALTPGEPPWPNTPCRIFADTVSYRTYKARINELRPSIGQVQGTAYHRWHGSLANRRYGERYKFMPELRGDEYPMDRRPDGLLEWTDQSCGDAAMAYFVGRREDE